MTMVSCYLASEENLTIPNAIHVLRSRLSKGVWHIHQHSHLIRPVFGNLAIVIA
jgi:hypothetical protein